MRRLAAALLVVLPTALPANAAELLGPSTTSHAVGVRPRGVAVVDLDLDGALDLVVANSGDSTADLLTGDGTGGFSLDRSLSVLDAPQSVVAPNLDRDGRPEIVVASRTGLTVVPGDGTAPQTISLGTSIVQIAAGEFDADGRADVVAIENGGEIWVLRGDGEGDLAVPALPLEVDSQARSIAVADLDGNGLDDFAVASSRNYVAIFFNDGSGGFDREDLALPSGASPSWIGAAALRGGPAVDLIVANQGRRSLSILLGDGLGEYLPAGEIVLEGVPRFAAVADFDANGTPDLALLERTADLLDPMNILLGDGAGGFARVARVPVDADPLFVTTDDLNRDGAPDVVTGNTTSDTVSVFLGNGLGGFLVAPTLDAGTQPESIAVADFDLDGHSDFAIVDNAGDALIVSRGDGRGGFRPPETLATETRPADVAVGRFNPDDLPDLAVTNSTSASLCVYLGAFDDEASRSGHFFLRRCEVQLGGLPERIGVADLDGDGFDDLVVTHERSFANSARVLQSDGNGGFAAPPVELSLDPGSSGVAIGRFDGDDHLDLALSQSSTDTVDIWLGDGAFGFRSKFEAGLAVGDAPADIVAGDLDRDGRTDLAVACENDDVVTVLLGDGTGGFSGFDTPAGERPRALEIVELNRDGNPDLAVAAADSNALFPLLGAGDGTFSHLPGLALPTQPWAVGVGAFDADLDPDLAVVNRVDGSVSILLGSLDARSDVNGSNRIDGLDVVEVGRRSGAAPNPDYARRADVNFDGVIDGDDLTVVGANFGGLRREPSPLRTEFLLDAAAGGGVTLAAGRSDGDLIAVDVIADTGSAAAAAEFSLLFDPADGDVQVLELAGSLPGNRFAAAATQVLDATQRVPGRVDVRAQSLPPSDLVVEGPSVVATLILRARREGIAELRFGSVDDDPPRLLTADDRSVPGVVFSADARVVVSAPQDDRAPGQKIGVFPRGFDFAGAAPGTTRTLRISNFGYSRLRVDSVLPSSAEFFTVPSPVAEVTVPPFGYVELRVGFSGAPGPVEASLAIVSDDPETGRLELPLLGGN
ncbi:MAG: hypothetical protein GY716_24725 [bacterium]|nr:hypothetical protein [bacterium]